ncbi:MAG: NAD(P)H-dependent glycerol-3-phosphate dehydrogenase [bacterium]|nr:NAD(P)H-dependent glycerol-3-phosphate dehydrogenase [bacterium]
MKVGVIGAGGWGTALSIVASHNAEEVVLVVREDAVQREITEQRTNQMFLKGATIPQGVLATQDLSLLVTCDLILMAVPSSFVKEMAIRIKPYVRAGVPLVNAAKGFETSTSKRLSTVLEEVFHGSNNPIAVISGPNHAEEIGRGLPAAIVAASQERDVIRFIQDALMTPVFRVYGNTDVCGVELGGALKNIIALAAGITDGLGYGDNTKAALMTRGLAEIVRLGKALGARQTTFTGLSGMGDLIVTCTSVHSRNRRAGLALAEGKSLSDILSGTNMVVEGVNATMVANNLSIRHQIAMPITEALYQVLFNSLAPRDAVQSLMTRLAKSEVDEVLPLS